MPNRIPIPMVVPLLLLGYSLLSANFTTGNVEVNGTSGGPIKFPGERDKRESVLATPPSASGEGPNGSEELSSSTTESEKEETRVKREEDDDTPLHEPDYEADKSDVGLMAALGLNASSTSTTTPSSVSSEEHLAAEAILASSSNQTSNNSSSGNEEEHLEHLAWTSAPLEPSRKRKRRASEASVENPEKEPFGANEEGVPSVEEGSAAPAVESGSAEKKTVGENSGQHQPSSAEGYSTTTTEEPHRLVRAIGLGHRARSQSVQKSQQQAGRGPKSDGTD